MDLSLVGAQVPVTEAVGQVSGAKGFGHALPRRFSAVFDLHPVDLDEEGQSLEEGHPPGIRPAEGNIAGEFSDSPGRDSTGPLAVNKNLDRRPGCPRLLSAKMRGAGTARCRQNQQKDERKEKEEYGPEV
jgi:hypothetical protein